MSLTPLEGQMKPYKCAVCGKDIGHDGVVDVKLICLSVYNVPGHEAGDWLLEMNWRKVEVTHSDCK